jgi:hypothetical protein
MGAFTLSSDILLFHLNSIKYYFSPQKRNNEVLLKKSHAVPNAAYD